MTIIIQNRADLEQRLITMKTQEGWSIRALARHLGISRNMVRRILRKHDKLRDQGHDILLTDRQSQKTKRASCYFPRFERVSMGKICVLF